MSMTENIDNIQNQLINQFFTSINKQKIDFN
jgi:hypothetical protein